MCCAVSVDARFDVNVALNRPSYQSSTARYFGFSHSAEKANDGNRDPDQRAGSCVHTKRDINPWWAVDLGVALYVDGVNFTNRNHSSGAGENPVFLEKKLGFRFFSFFDF